MHCDRLLRTSGLRGIVATLLLPSLLTLGGCTGKNDTTANANPGPMPVTVIEVQPTSLPALLELTAQTEGAKETEVRARVGGILVKRL